MARSSANIGDDVTVGRFALVHACTVEDRVVVGDAALVMDDAHVGAGSLITAGSLVPPRKQLAGGWIYDGYPATPVREIGAAELAEAARRDPPAHSVGARHGDRPAAARRWTAYAPARPTIDAAASPPDRQARRSADAYVAPTALRRRRRQRRGRRERLLRLRRSSPATAGSRSDRARTCRTIRCSSPMRRAGRSSLGADVTIGHNVRMGAATIGDHALIGMGSQVGRRRRRRRGRMHRRARAKSRRAR